MAMMNDKIVALVDKIGTALKDFATGNVDLSLSKEIYDKLLEEYEQLEIELENPNSCNIVHGVLYFHNVRNCCIHSSLYVYKKNSAFPLYIVGDSAITKKIVDAIVHQKIVCDGAVHRLGGESIQLPSHTLYAKSLGFSKGSPIFCALTSSMNFVEEVFNRTAYFLSLILQINNSEMQYYNYFNEIKKVVDEFIDTQIAQNRQILAIIFIFRNIEKIFSHMGFRTLIDVIANIKKTIQDSFGSNTLCVNPSLRLFVALIPTSHMGVEEIRKKKIEFHYQGLALPFQRLNLPLALVDAKERLWYDIFYFEDYIIRGDVHK